MRLLVNCRFRYEYEQNDDKYHFGKIAVFVSVGFNEEIEKKVEEQLTLLNYHLPCVLSFTAQVVFEESTNVEVVPEVIEEETEKCCFTCQNWCGGKKKTDIGYCEADDDTAQFRIVVDVDDSSGLSVRTQSRGDFYCSRYEPQIPY